MRKLDGRVAIITGGARGLGRADALHLAELGADIGVLDLDLSPWEHGGGETTPIIEAIEAFGVKAVAVAVDVRDAGAVAQAVDDVRSQLGPISIAITNAGGGSRGSTEALKQYASAMDLDEFRRKIEVNLFGQVHTITAAAPDMKKQRYGKIVTVASVSGQMARPDGSNADYGAAKAAVIQYTRSLAAELGPYGITANCVTPGLIATSRNVGKYGGDGDAVQNVALRRLGTPEEVAKVIGFLCTDESSYVTGATIDAHGGTRVPWWSPPLEPWWPDGDAAADEPSA